MSECRRNKSVKSGLEYYATMETKDYTSKKTKMNHVFYMAAHMFYSTDTLHGVPINWLSPLAALN